jgi:hypothetical protein
MPEVDHSIYSNKNRILAKTPGKESRCTMQHSGDRLYEID